MVSIWAHITRAKRYCCEGRTEAV